MSTDFQFLAPLSFNSNKDTYDFDYAQLIDYSFVSFKFSNGFTSYVIISGNNNNPFAISFPNFLIYDRNKIINTDKLLSFNINRISCEILNTNIEISNINFTNSEITNNDKWKKFKNEITEFNFYHGSQIIYNKLYPSTLNVLGVTIGESLEKKFTKSKLQLFSLPGTLSNYLMQLKYSFENIINYTRIDAININGFVIYLYNVAIEFSESNFLYKNSIKDYEKLIGSSKGLKLNTMDDCLNNYNIYCKKEQYKEYFFYNKLIKMTQNETILDVFYNFRKIFYVYSHENDNDLKRDLLRRKPKHKSLLVRLFNPELRYYETGKNWEFSNSDSPKRYLDIGSGYYYDSYTGLGYNKETSKFDVKCPSIDWKNIKRNTGLWTDYIN